MFGRSTLLDDIRREINTDKVITRLIIVNVLVFVVLNLTMVVGLIATGGNRVQAYHIVQQILYWVQMPGNPVTLLHHPWAPVTHLFVHYQIFHLLFNMFNLFWFGAILHEYIGPRKLLPLYFYGGIAGALVFIVSANIFPFLSPVDGAIGASASVMAIIVAAATLLPDYTLGVLLIGPVKLKYIAMVLVLLDILLLHDPGVGHIAHLGGALFGFIYIRQMQVGHDWSRPFNATVDFFANLPGRFRKKKYPRMAYRRETVTTIGRRSAPIHSNSKTKQERIDSILDKINQSGYDSLSKDDKEFLFRSSKDD